MIALHLNLIQQGGKSPLEFRVKRLVNAGYVGRNIAAVKAHIDELSHEGVPPPPAIPMVFPVLSHNITTGSHIEVIGTKTSGETEYALLVDGKNIYVGIGSDHTDRALEAQSITKSKQICQNVLSKDIWNLKEVESHWDTLQLRCWVKPSKDTEAVLYQDAPLAKIISATDLLKLIRDRLKDSETDGMVIFSGTVPFLAPKMIYGCHYRCELADTKLKRNLALEYEVHQLEYVKEMETL